MTIFGIFNEFLSTQNVNVARFARNVECDFLDDFQTLCTGIHRKVGLPQKCAPYEQAPFSALRNVTAFIDVAGNFPSTHSQASHQADKFTKKEKNMDFDYYNNVENLNYGFVNINSVDINLNEVSDHSDFSDTEVVPTYFDFESSMNIEDMMTALDKDIIFSNDEPIPDNDNSFANLEDKVEDICNTIENNGKFLNWKNQKNSKLNS